MSDQQPEPPQNQPPPRQLQQPPDHQPRPPIITRSRNHTQLVNVRDRLFHTLFYRGALAYARTFPKPIRRLIEFVVLVKAFTAFFILVYIHHSFSKTTNTCLDSEISNWPRDGILRVEIVRNMEEGYSLEHSYAKEERLNRMGREDLSSMLGLLTAKLDLEPSPMEHGVKESDAGDSASGEMSYSNETIDATSTKFRWIETFTETPRKTSEYSFHGIKPGNTTEKPRPTLPNPEKYIDSRLLERGEVYIVEYALEYGYLRLSPAARAKLKIPIKSVFLDPGKHRCFGDAFSKFILEEFLGYNDLLMTSVKTFAEKEENKGYLKNVVTGEHYRFVNLWMGKSSYIPAVICMLIFTVIVSMLLRYAHHQIFVFIVDLLQMLEFNLSITFPTAPLLTVILALVGIEAIMSEFFNDTTTAFYVILIVWLADQYDAICCHITITKRHWLKFFYLYHFVFYAYQYRFNGQYTGLCLIVHWLFIQHSMIYFFHHYELPEMLQQAHFQHMLLLRSTGQQPGGPLHALDLPQIRARFTQLFSLVVRSSATTQTSTIAVSPRTSVATSTVATSTSTITSSSVPRSTATVGTTAQPVNTSQSIQTMPTAVETVDSQTSCNTLPPSVAVSIQTNDEGTRPPSGGPEGSQS